MLTIKKFDLENSNVCSQKQPYLTTAAGLRNLQKQCRLNFFTKTWEFKETKKKARAVV
jgi:hypothetical protein